MLFNNFVEISKGFWAAYLSGIYRADKAGKLQTFRLTPDQLPHETLQPLPPKARVFYPTTLLCTMSPTHFVFELLGVSRQFTQLIVKRHKVESTNSYFNQFPITSPDTFLTLNSQWLNWTGGLLSNADNKDKITRRFPFLESANWYDCGHQAFNSEADGTISIGADADFVTLRNLILVNSFDTAYRLKHILLAGIFKRTTEIAPFKEYQTNLANDPIMGISGVFISALDHACELHTASQFCSVFLSPKLRETTIGAFLNSHPDFITNALGCSKFVYEPYLIWKEGNPNPNEQAINPDLLVEGPNGLYDIYDLKTALLSNPSLTKGQRRRRRFIDVVADGVAQLANYKEYFEYQKNRDYAFERYGIRISRPKLVLIVGNYENFRPHEVEEAKRMLKDIEIIDYDTLLSLFLARAIPSQQ